MLRSPHEENGVGEIQHKVCETSEDNTKNGLGEDFWNILAQDFIIGLSCRMLVAICLCMPMPSRGNDKIFQVQMLETMIMMHP